MKDKARQRRNMRIFQVAATQYFAIIRRLFVAFSLKNSLNLDGKTEEVDEACGILLVINFVCIKCCEILAVECVG